MALLILTVAGLLLVQSQPLMQRALVILARLPLAGKAAPRVATAYESSRRLLSWRLLFVSTVISVVSWFGECAAMYYVLAGLGVSGEALLLKATFVFCGIDALWSGVIFARRTGGVGSVEHRIAGTACADGCRSCHDGDDYHPLLHPLVRREPGSRRTGAVQPTVWRNRTRGVRG